MLGELKDIMGQLETGDITKLFVHKADFGKANCWGGSLASKAYRHVQFESLVSITKFEKVEFSPKFQESKPRHVFCGKSFL